MPESAGGQGLGVAELALLGAEMGRHLLPLPYLSTVALAGGTLGALSEPGAGDEWMQRVASGETRAAVVMPAPWLQRGGDVGYEGSPGGYRIRGGVAGVADAAHASMLLVAARGGGGDLALFACDPGAAGVEVLPQPTLDATRPLAEVRLDCEVPEASRLGEADATAALEQGLDRARILMAAEAVGGSERCLEMSVEYAKVREQFGKPIGSFQGVSHMLVDSFLAVESAKSLVYRAAWAQDADPDNASLAAASARVLECDGFRRVAETAIQAHGGIGITWEHDLHLYYRRALWNATYPQDLVEERERVAHLMEA
jgi:acyl-CoA dehydrogenase